MWIRSLPLALLAIAAPLSAQLGGNAQRSPSMLLFPVDAVAPAGSFEMLMSVPSQGVSAVGAGASIALLPRVRIAAQAVVGRAEEALPELGQRAERGWYGGAGALGIWTLAGDHRTGLDLAVGVQVDHSTADAATRTTAPAGLTARLASRIGGVEMQPFVGGGVSLRRDNREAYRAWNSVTALEGAATAGWYAHGGVRFGTQRFWVQPALTWSKVFGDGGFPPAIVHDLSGNALSARPLIERAPLVSLRAGFTP